MSAQTTSLHNSLHDSISSTGFSVADPDDFELVSVTSESEPISLNTRPLGLTAYHTSDLVLPHHPPEPVPAPGCLEQFETARLTIDDIQENVNRLIEATEDSQDTPEQEEPECDNGLDESLMPGAGIRGYKINKPPKMRPVRVYIAALFDVLHPGHVLNLRQAKYSFPSVHLLVGVFAEAPPHAPAIFSHLERLETVRHIRYIDELIPEAPLQLTEEFIREWNIDYVAYEEDTAWNDPGYQLARRLGKFLPLRSTGSITTGEVLQRLRGEQRDLSDHSSLGSHGREDTILAKASLPQLKTEFAPLTPASVNDEDSPESDGTPEPHELLDPFTN